MSAGARFRAALEAERPLQIVGTINAFTALLAQRAGFRAIYLSGAGVANASFGLPDLAMTTLNDVCEDVRRIASATEAPLLVDADTGWGSAFMIGRTVREMTWAGAAACHLEDQVAVKRCGHRPGKALVEAKEMCDRIKAAVDGRIDDQFVIMARTDAHAVEGHQAALDRAAAYVEAGADMIFAEALTTLDEYRQFTDTIRVPVLANLTEFGKTPLFTTDELAEAGIRMALYPLTAFRAMSATALDAYVTLRANGTQAGFLDKMQPREELYDVLGYQAYEDKLDALFAEKALETGKNQSPRPEPLARTINMADNKKTGGLAGVTAGKTALCTVGKEGAGLTYCGYDIYDLADNATFEEVAYLLLRGRLPSRAEFDEYIAKIKTLRGLPDALKTVLEMAPADAHPMDVLRTGVSFLGNIEPEGDFANQLNVANRLLACLPSMMVYWHRFHTDGKRIDTETDDDSVSGHILHMLHDKPPSKLHQKSLDTTLILHAEHEFNASTFAGRVITGTLSDMHSAVTGAIGALRGSLHGGANEAAMELIQKFDTPEAATTGVLGMLERRDLIMGFGHRVYTTSDPRNSVNKAMSKTLAGETGDMTLYEVSEAIEKVMWDEKKLFANADFFAASVYHFMGIPTYLFTPIFVCSRITGWTAHIMEQRADNKLIRPAADYVGPSLQEWVAIEDR